MSHVVCVYNRSCNQPIMKGSCICRHYYLHIRNTKEAHTCNLTLYYKKAILQGDMIFYSLRLPVNICASHGFFSVSHHIIHYKNSTTNIATMVGKWHSQQIFHLNLSRAPVWMSGEETSRHTKLIQCHTNQCNIEHLSLHSHLRCHPWWWKSSLLPGSLPKRWVFSPNSV